MWNYKIEYSKGSTYITLYDPDVGNIKIAYDTGFVDYVQTDIPTAWSGGRGP